MIESPCGKHRQLTMEEVKASHIHMKAAFMRRDYSDIETTVGMSILTDVLYHLQDSICKQGLYTCDAIGTDVLDVLSEELKKLRKMSEISK